MSLCVHETVELRKAQAKQKWPKSQAHPSRASNDKPFEDVAQQSQAFIGFA